MKLSKRVGLAFSISVIGTTAISACAFDPLLTLNRATGASVVAGGDCGAFTPATFDFPADELSCNGAQRVRFDDALGLAVGVVTCDTSDEIRIYLAPSTDGPFLPATDWAGNGQDHCQLVNPAFTSLPDEDDITSGGCAACSTSQNLPLEGVSTYARGNFGERFALVEQTPEWSYQTSRLRCGVAVDTCNEIAPPAAEEPIDEELIDEEEPIDEEAIDEEAIDEQPNVCGFAPASFDFPLDELACDGDQLVRFDEALGLHVGVVTCASSDEVRLYLAAEEAGPFLPATDTAGHGQDHCALVNASFSLPNEDDITSGGCFACSTSLNLPLEGVAAYARAYLGEEFQLVDETPEWSHQVSRLRCGVNVVTCE